MAKGSISKKQREELLKIMQVRFEKNQHRHKSIQWVQVQAKLEGNTEKMWSLHEMERTGGEPDIVSYDKKAVDKNAFEYQEIRRRALL
jgi:Protein of unknown function (DUF4256)